MSLYHIYLGGCINVSALKIELNQLYKTKQNILRSWVSKYVLH